MFMLSFLKRKSIDIFNIQNDICFLNVLDNDDKIDLYVLLTCLYSLIEVYDKIVISIAPDMNELDKFKIVLCKNISNKISYLIS